MEEQRTFTDVVRHYSLAKQDLQQRFIYFDKADILFRSHIIETSWPYRATVFDPRIFTTLYEKTARNLANKPKGRLIPREGGDSLGGKINNELLDFQWDDNVRVDNMPMLGKWSMMDLNGRKYGSSFGLCKWQWQRQVERGDTNNLQALSGNVQKEVGKAKVFFDGPNFRPLNNRDCLPNPAYSTIKNWFQHRDYVTFQDLADVNDAARGKPIYKNLDLLKAQIQRQSEGGGDTRARNYTMKNLSIRGLTDYLGRDTVYKTIELVTEYRPDRWITFSPFHGVVIRDIPNPYKHGQIPVVMLRYYPIDEDIYGLSEIEPVEKIQKALNALICQYLDAINMSLYAPLKVRSTGGAVQMHTLEFGPGKKWLMNDPATDVITHQQNISGVQEFTETYRFLISAYSEAMGETSEGVSNLVPGSGNKTATEIKDTAQSRSARDNFNQMFLGEAIKKQMMFWFKMNQQFMFSDPSQKNKIIQIGGKDSLRYFQSLGLDGQALTDDGIDALTKTQEAGYSANPKDLLQPLFPVNTKEGTVPKLQMDEGGQQGTLLMEPADLEGDYDYIPDVSSMSSNATENEVKSRSEAIQMLTGVDPKTGQPIGVAAMLAKEGIQVKVQDLVEDYLEDIGMKDASKYFEKIPQNPMMQGGGLQNGQAQIDPNGPGAAGAQGMSPSMGNVGVGGMGAGVQAVPGGEAQPVIPGSV